MSDDTPRNLIVCSDGTGNTAIKGRGSNVFKLYEAVDLEAHLRPHDRGRKQVAIYDDGVGTQSLRAIRLFSGAFGWGLKKNVRQLYIELSRAYTPGSQIYLFGFSRGAFTVRTLAGLVASRGLIRDARHLDEVTLQRIARGAQTAFREEALKTAFVQWIVSGLFLAAVRLVTKRYDYDREDFLHDDRLPTGEDAEPRRGKNITFVGVWDTVEALGFPIAGIANLWNFLIFRFQFPERTLSPRVASGAHALAIDDQRKTFWPILWNEGDPKKEQEVLGGRSGWRIFKRDLRDGWSRMKAARRDRKEGASAAAPRPEAPAEGEPPPRIQQVWFAGVHSNVGGGYPKQGMSMVALRWMMERAEEAGAPPRLRFRRNQKREIRARENVTDQLYDSRSGAGVIYRFCPRQISWLCERAEIPVRIHHSVVERLSQRTQGYAPFNLPPHFEVVDAPKGAPVSGLVEAGGARREEDAFRRCHQLAGRRQWLQRFIYVAGLLWVGTAWGHPEWLVPVGEVATLVFSLGGALPWLSETLQGALVAGLSGLASILPGFVGDGLSTLLGGLGGWMAQAVSLIVGSLPGGPWLDENVLQEIWRRPNLFWAVVSSLGLLFFAGSRAATKTHRLASGQWAGTEIVPVSEKTS